MLENDAGARNPVGFFSVYEMPHDLAGAPRVCAFIARVPRGAGVTKKSVENSRRPAQDVEGLRKLEVHHRFRLIRPPFVRSSQRKLQKADVSPSSANNCSVSPTVLRRHSGCLRSGRYQASASLHPVSRDNTAPRSNRHESHHRSTCSSDRKKSIVFQVNTMSFHQLRAGMAK